MITCNRMEWWQSLQFQGEELQQGSSWPLGRPSLDKATHQTLCRKYQTPGCIIFLTGSLFIVVIVALRGPIPQTLCEEKSWNTRLVCLASKIDKIKPPLIYQIIIWADQYHHIIIIIIPYHNITITITITIIIIIFKGMITWADALRSPLEVPSDSG